MQSQDSYFIDYRTGEFVKNLDTTSIAPELYDRVVIDDALHGMYQHTYEDDMKGRLTLVFSREEISNSTVSFEVMLQMYCQEYNFVPQRLVDKVMFISQAFFNEMHAYQGGV